LALQAQTLVSVAAEELQAVVSVAVPLAHVLHAAHVSPFP